MINDYLSKPYEAGTVLKESTEFKDYYYLVGPYFIYCNHYDDPYIRPHKFLFNENVTVATEEEKKAFLEDLRKNHLIVTEEFEVEKEFTDYTVTIRSKLTKEQLKEMFKTSELSEIGEVIRIS